MKSQFLLAFFLLAALSCKTAFNEVSDNTLDDQYTYIANNSKYNIKFHSLGGRKIVNRFLYKSYGTLVFTNEDHLRSRKPKKRKYTNKIYSSLFIVKKIPEEVKKWKTAEVNLYNTKVLCYEKEYGKVYERYFQYGNSNYVFVVEFNRTSKDYYYAPENYISEEMEGLEL